MDRDRRENGPSLVRRFFGGTRSVLVRTNESAVDHVALAVALLG